MANSNRFVHLDAIRGLAAILVLASHLRAYLFQSYSELSSLGDNVVFGTKLFYFSTGLGHQAVIIFFALSGFLVGGKALTEISASSFKWREYFARRLTRLWTVIFPTMLLAYMLDTIGFQITDGVGYDGSYYDRYSEGPKVGDNLSHSFTTFIANMLFLQTIYAPVYGTNQPMWSLANEFWYYITIPLAAWVMLYKQRTGLRIAGLLILIYLSLSLPAHLFDGGIIWAAGALASRFTNSTVGNQVSAKWYVRSITLFLAVASLVATKTSMFHMEDLPFGISVAVTLPVIAHLQSPSRLYAKICGAMSDISFSLYMSHFPLLTFIVMMFFAPHRFPVGSIGAANFLVIFILCLSWGVLIWFFFERNTNKVYCLIASYLPS